MLWLVTICLITLPIALILVSSAVVLYYTNSRDTSILPTTVSIVGLSLVLLYAGLIPIDVFAAERVIHIGDFIRDLYYITVSTLLCVVFGAVPFAYFYSTATRRSEEDEDEYLDVNEIFSGPSDTSRDNDVMARTTLVRLRIACRNTSMCLCLLVVFILIMVVLHTVLTESSPTTYDTVGTMKRLFHSAATGHAVLNLTIGVIILAGTLNLWVYTALGLAALPTVGCIKLGWTGVRDSCQSTSEEDEYERAEQIRRMNLTRTEKSRQSAYDEIHKQRSRNTRERQNLYDKYGVTGRKGKKMPSRAKKKSERLEARQVYLSDRLAKLEAENERELRRKGQQRPSCCHWCWKCVLRQIVGSYNCIKLPMGMISLILSLTLWWSTVITVLNKFLGSEYEHGYIVHALPTLFNPLDWFMRVSFFFYYSNKKIIRKMKLSNFQILTCQVAFFCFFFYFFPFCFFQKKKVIGLFFSIRCFCCWFYCIISACMYIVWNVACRCSCTLHSYSYIASSSYIHTWHTFYGSKCCFYYYCFNSTTNVYYATICYFWCTNLCRCTYQ